MNIAILLPAVHEFDAISIDAMLQKKFFEDRNCTVRIYSESWGKMDGIYNINHFDKFIKNNIDIVLFHYSTWWQKGIEFIRNTRAKVLLKYHNITPAKYFENINAHYQERCELGRQTLKKLIQEKNIFSYIADSNFNQLELKEWGVEKCKILPPFMQINDLLDCEADLDLLTSLKQDWKQNILMVGRIAPNKGIESLLRVFKIWNNQFQPDSQLIIAGGMDLEMTEFNKKIRNLIDDLGITSNVLLTGFVDLSALKSIYLASDLFLTLSEHEGFCVPIVESQALGLPILALDSGAISQTAQNGALIWEDNQPDVLAASINRILNDPVLKNHLIVEGRKNYYTRFEYKILEQQLEKIMNDLGIKLE